jgi:hypothetical protein
MKLRGWVKKMSKYAPTLFATVLLLFFQNCSFKALAPKSMASSVSADKSDVGGTGYDGKIYIARGAVACGDGAQVSSVIEVNDAGSANLVRKNCEDLAQPEAHSLAEIGLMAHNEDNAMLANQLFDRLSDETTPGAPGSIYTKFLCRGIYDKDSKGQQVADVMIKYTQGSETASAARVIFASYNASGILQYKSDSGSLPLKNISTQVAGRVKYVSGEVGDFEITLWIDKTGDETRTGKLIYIDSSGEHTIQNLNCFSQE